MKNLIYAGVIAVCVLLAVVVFVWTRGSSGSGLEDLSDAEMTWVKCLKCGQSYEMGLKAYLKEVSDKAMVNPAMPVTPLLTCQKCSKDGIVKACKCEKCGEVFRENSVVGDHSDRCPKCKYSAIEASRKARQAGTQQQ